MSKVLSERTAARLLRMLNAHEGGSAPRRGGARGASWKLVRCTSATPVGGDDVLDQCYPAVILSPASDYPAPPEELFPCLLTVLGDDAEAVAPTEGAVYAGLLTWEVESDRSGSGSSTVNGRPRVFAANPDPEGITGSGTDNRIARWDGTDAIQDSGVQIDDSGHLTFTANTMKLGWGLLSGGVPYLTPASTSILGVYSTTGGIGDTPNGALWAGALSSATTVTAGTGYFAAALPGLTGTLGPGAAASFGLITTLGSGSFGTVTTTSVVTANGVSGSVANATTTPAITITLGAITPTSVATPTITQTAASAVSVPHTITGAAAQSANYLELKNNAGDLVLGIGEGSAAFTSLSGLFTFGGDVGLLDSNGTHFLLLSAGSDLTANRTLTFTTGDADRTVTITGAASISGTNTGDQNTFGTIAVSGQSDVVADTTGDTLTLVAGTGITLTTNAGTDAITITCSVTGVSDGDKGDITVSSSGTVWNIDAGVVGATELADFSGFASAALSLAVSVPVYDPVAAANRQTSADRLMALQPTIPGGRLTLTTGVPVTAGDVTAATTIYYTPHHNDRITLEDGSRWVTIEFTEKSLAIGAVTADLPYDIFGVLSGGALAIEKLAWTNATTRATAVTIQDGRYCKSGDKTRLYLGTICPYSTTQVADSALASTGGRGVWNMYNRVRRHLSAVDTTDSWNYTTTTWRSANSSTANRVKFVRGLDEDAMSARVACQASNATSINAAVGVGVDSTSVNSAQVYLGVIITSALLRADYCGFPGAGFHFLQWLEISQASGSTTWFGDGGLSYQQAGMVAEGWF